MDLPGKMPEALGRFRLRISYGSATSARILIAVLIGLGGGLFAFVFRTMINLTHRVFFDGGGALLQPGLGRYWVVLVPAAGGLIVGPLVWFFAREAKGHGVPEVIEAVALRGGRIRPRVIFVKALASATTIGSGGSVGREGPIVQMGAAIGSLVAQCFRMSDEMRKTLVACGAAAGISATFNAPVAGAIFALEVILGNFTAGVFSLIVISSVTSSVVGWVLMGNAPAFEIPAMYSVVSMMELIWYALLGILIGLTAVLFTRTLYKFEDIFDYWRRFPPYLKPVVGGLIVGAIGVWFPQIFGVGYEAITDALKGNIALNVLIALIVIKILATSVTIGSGGSGGVFAPSLFLGSVTGGAFGSIVHNLYPVMTAVSGAYALVGMAAMVAGTTQAPITAVLIVFEMTRDYQVILPLMTGVVFATMVSMLLSEDSIYTLKLRRRGVNVRGVQEAGMMRETIVAEAMVKKVDFVRDTDTLMAVIKELQSTHHTGFPVLDAADRLVGIITLDDVRNTSTDRPGERLNHMVRDVMSRDLIVAFADESLSEVVKRLAFRGIGRVPVVSRQDQTRMEGAAHQDGHYQDL